MKNLFKKNQLMITALAIMIAIAGYLQFADSGLEQDILTVEKDNIKEVSDITGEITENYTAEGLGGSQIAEGLEITEGLEISEEDLLAESFEDIESLDYDLDEYADNYLDTEMVVETDSAAVTNTPDEGEIPGEAVYTSTNALTVLSDAKLLKEQTRAKNKETLMNIINSTGLTDTQKQAAVDSMVKMTEYAESEASAEILLSAKGFSDSVVSISQDGVDVVVNELELSDVQRAQIIDIVMRKTNFDASQIVISAIVEE